MTARKKAPAKEQDSAMPKLEDEAPTVEEVRERTKAAKAAGTMDKPPAVDGDGDAIVREGGFSLDDAEPADDDPAEVVAADPDDPYAGLSREELVAKLDEAKGKAKYQSYDRRATLMFAPRGNCAFYLDGKLNGSWDKNEPEAHVWRQVGLKCQVTGEQEVDVVHWPHRVLPETLPAEKDLGIRATPKLADVVKNGPKKQGPGGPTTSYQTSMAPVESLG